MAHDIDPAASELGDSKISAATPGDSAVEVKAGVPFFLVTAYRWGCTNEHAYHIYGGPDRTKALAMARAENADRGGKYATVVWEFDGDGTDYRNIAYFQSSAEAEQYTGPHHNHRIDFYERVGQFLNEAATGTALLPDPKNERHMTYQAVGPLPDFLLSELERQRRFLKIWEDNSSDLAKGGAQSTNA